MTIESKVLYGLDIYRSRLRILAYKIKHSTNKRYKHMYLKVYSDLLEEKIRVGRR